MSKKGRTEFIGFFVSPSEKIKIQAAADERCRSVSDYMRLSVHELIKVQRKKRIKDADEEYAALVAAADDAQVPDDDQVEAFRGDGKERS